MDYRVELDAYAGPMDLLLYLIKEAEVDIYDIPIGEITDRYLEHLEAIRKIDLGRAGEFLVLASQLMEIKAKMLIPREVIEMEDVEDPRAGLVQELLEYRKFKEASRQLGERLSEEDRRFPRLGTPEIEGDVEEVESEELADLGVYDLLTAFSRIRKEILDVAPPSIVYDDIPIRVHMERVVAGLSEREVISFRDLILGARDRREMIGIFLALLELVKLRRIRARQSAQGEEILITLREPGPMEPRLGEDEGAPPATGDDPGESPSATDGPSSPDVHDGGGEGAPPPAVD